MKREINSNTRLSGVIANPIKHSLSPIIHNTGFAEYEINSVYLALETKAEEIDGVIQSIKHLNMLGANVSMPYKNRAFKQMDKLTPMARLTESVNTIKLEEGLLIGDNTDGIGFVRSLKEEGVYIAHKKVAVLGAGGASKAIICQMALEGVGSVHVFKRHNQTFQEVVTYFDRISRELQVPIFVHPYEEQETMNQIISTCDILVNGTHIGMGQDSKDTPIPVLSLPLTKEHVLVDLIYHPSETLFLKQGKQKGCHSINGLGMLIYQASAAFHWWTGYDLPIEHVKRAIEEEMIKRG